MSWKCGGAAAKSKTRQRVQVHQGKSGYFRSSGAGHAALGGSSSGGAEGHGLGQLLEGLQAAKLRTDGVGLRLFFLSDQRRGELFCDLEVQSKWGVLFCAFFSVGQLGLVV